MKHFAVKYLSFAPGVMRQRPVLATWSICSRIMREKEELKVIVDEFLGKGGINTASLKCVCENAKTRELAQGGDVEAAERTFYIY